MKIRTRFFLKKSKDTNGTNFIYLIREIGVVHFYILC